MEKGSRMKTAMQWFVEAFFDKSRISTYHSEEQDEVISLSDFSAIVEKAKEMESEQMKDAYFADRDFCSGGVCDETFDGYYDYKYGGKDE